MKCKIMLVLQCVTVAVVMMLGPALNGAQDAVVVRVDGGVISVEFTNTMKSRIISRFDEKDKIMGDFSSSETITIDGKEHRDFTLIDHSERPIEDVFGKGIEFRLVGSDPPLRKEIAITSYDDIPDMLFYQVTYVNTGNQPLTVMGWSNNHYAITAHYEATAESNIPFWTYQPGSYGWENDWIRPLEVGYSRDNYLGMTWEDYGGGTPVVDIWRRDAGMAVGHIEMTPKQVSLPVSMPNENYATIAVTYSLKRMLGLEEKLTTFRTFVAVHRGDYFTTLSKYSQLMVQQGIEFKDPPQAVYEPIWCGWGYGRDFTINQITSTLPKVRELGIDWVVLDYGWSTGVGDNKLHPDKFPNGDADMRKLVKQIHDSGAKAKLWWSPLSTQPHTELYKNHRDYLLLNEDGTPREIEFWKAFFLCPAVEEVQTLSKDFIVKAMKDWGWDGFKIDGNFLNTMPPCYNKEHHHEYPEQSVEQLPEFLKMLYETALSINPEAVVEICPCGTNYSFFILPYMNQSVASDPSNSWQIRQKGKTLKALSGSKVAFYGDHVELSDEGCDFASTVGIGGVIGTKFTLTDGPPENSRAARVMLTAEKEQEWARWIKIYKEHMLPLGDYCGELYDIGFDRPEAHAIQKGSDMYYAFYAPTYEGKVELRGLHDRTYKILDYVNGKDLGTVNGPFALLNITFNKHLLIKAIPQ